MLVAYYTRLLTVLGMQLPPPELTPVFARGLPSDSVGRPVPAETPWPGGKPVLSKIDAGRMLILFKAPACAVCGYPMEAGDARWRGVSYDDAREFQRDGGQRRRDGAGHLSCMLWAACVCPYFADKSGRRGRKAAVIGADELMVSAASDGTNANLKDALITYSGIARIYWFDDPRTLLPHLSTAIACDPEPAAPRLYWTDDAQADDEALRTLRRIVRSPAAIRPMGVRELEDLRASTEKAHKPMRLR